MQFFTIGVYGSSNEEFFDDLVQYNIDTFCDIRRRRAVRGAQYAFANSNQLQSGLKQHDIQYLHIIDLAPSADVIAIQDKADKKQKIARRQRNSLSQDFVDVYQKEVLDKFNMEAFITQLQWINAQRIALFCVEESEAACHRGIVAEALKEMGYGVEHL